VVVVVAAEHERFWREELRALPPGCVLAQPENRGTAPGLLLPLLAILERDHDAVIAVFPSDHFVAREAVLASAVSAGLGDACHRQAEITLLGMEPDAPDTEYGWILPHGDCGPSRRVAAFVEKPDVAVARQLHVQGALWNSFVMAARCAALLELYRHRLPDLLRAFERAAPHASVAAGRDLYASLAACDFSRHVLQGAEDRLHVRNVRHCGWTDLGTPERLAQCLRQTVAASGDRGAVVDLRQAFAQQCQTTRSASGASSTALLR
jgi:mannose-1-phosphate guanylyltransferase